jgi:hypothetical protein
MNAQTATVLGSVDRQVMTGLKLKIQLDDVTERLGLVSNLMRDFAAGDSWNWTIDGSGKVTVAKPVAPTSKIEFIVDPAKWASLDNLVKTMLIQTGVVTIETKTSSGRAAAVTWKPNV